MQEHLVHRRDKEEPSRNPASSNLSSFKPSESGCSTRLLRVKWSRQHWLFFSGKGKATCWKAFMEADDEVTDCLSQLGRTASIPSDDTMALIEKLVCQLYLPKTELSSVSELRWWLFLKKKAQSERFSPTQAALREAILRAHHQALVWNNDIVANPTLSSPEKFGLGLHGEKWVPIMTTLPPATQAIIHLVKGKCAKERCSTSRCQCQKNGLNCTDLCGCSDDGERCENVLDDDSDDKINTVLKKMIMMTMMTIMMCRWRLRNTLLKVSIFCCSGRKKKFWFWLCGKLPLSIRIKLIQKLVYFSTLDWPVKASLWCF